MPGTREEVVEVTYITQGLDVHALGSGVVLFQEHSLPNITVPTSPNSDIHIIHAVAFVESSTRSTRRLHRHAGGASGPLPAIHVTDQRLTMGLGSFTSMYSMVMRRPCGQGI